MFPLFLRLPSDILGLRSKWTIYRHVNQSKIRNLVWTGRKHIRLKKISQKLTVICVLCLFTKLSQNVYLIIKRILIYWYARCNCKFCKVPWFCCVFWDFSYNIGKNSCLNCCISTKLPQIVCLINVHILKCHHAECAYRLRKIFWFNEFFGGIFIYILFHVIVLRQKCWNKINPL